jgi:hypothetical protein
VLRHQHRIKRHPLPFQKPGFLQTGFVFANIALYTK